MSTRRYVFRRLLYALPVIIGVTLIVFVLFNVVIDDPTPILLGKHATAERMAELRHELGIDRPLWRQYLDTLWSAMTLSFGRSWVTKQSIGEMFREGAWISISLSLPAFIVSSALSILVALLSAFYRGKFADKFIVMFSVAMMSVSALTYILAGQWFFGYKLGWFPIMGYEAGFPQCIPYLILPWIVWIVLSVGPDARFYRSVILEEVHQNYVRTARSKGLAEHIVLCKHVLKNAMIPILTSLVMQLPTLILGAVLIESFFGIPGLGGLAIQAINQSDFPVLKAMTILMSLLHIAFSVLVDILYVRVDPRMKLQ